MISTKCLNDDCISPVGLSFIKAHLRIDGSHEDNYLQELIEQGTCWVENLCNISLIKKTYEQIWDFSHEDIHGLNLKKVSYQQIPLKGPVMEISNVFEKKYDGLTEVTKQNYKLETNENRSTLILNKWIKSGKIKYKSGYGENPANIPLDIKSVISMWVHDSYNNRGILSSTMQKHLRSLLDNYTVRRVL